MLYFDHNATSPLCAPARAAWLAAAEQYPGNPSSQHRLGSRADRALEGARARLSELLGCGPETLLWTSGATESVNTVFHHVARLHPEGHVCLSALEHPCVQAAAERWFPGRLHHIPATSTGYIDLTWLRAHLHTQRPVLVAVMAANNETGVLQPWSQALELCRHAGVPFLCDAAQWIGKLPAHELGRCDYVTGCGHKFGGPLGIGFLKGPPSLRPLLVGGPQEEGRRAGTENLPGALALVAALEARQEPLGDRELWRDRFLEAVQATIPGSRVLGGDTERLWNTATLLLPAPDCRVRWIVKLDKEGIAASTGSACASGKEAPSHVLRAMKLSAEESGRVVRFSSGWETTAADWERLLAVVQKVHASMGSAPAVVHTQMTD